MPAWGFPRLSVFTGALKLCCASHLLITQTYILSPTEGPSMLPTLSTSGDYIFADKLFHRRGRNCVVGDLIIYRIPLEHNVRGIKRIIGMPGDYVEIGSSGEGKVGEETMIQVPEGHCWVVGDNTLVSRDSRTFGPLPMALIEGKVLAKVLPWRDRAWMTGMQPHESPKAQL